MIRFRLPSVLLLVLPLSLACSRGGEAQTQEEIVEPATAAASAAELETFRTEYQNAYNRQDAAAASAMWAEDAVVHSADGTVHRGKPAIQALLDRTLPGLQSFTMTS